MQADFTPYAGKAAVSLQGQAAAAAAMTQAAFAGHVPGGDAGKPVARPESAGAGQEPNTSADADLAMALQMQEVRGLGNTSACRVVLGQAAGFVHGEARSRGRWGALVVRRHERGAVDG